MKLYVKYIISIVFAMLFTGIAYYSILAGNFITFALGGILASGFGAAAWFILLQLDKD